VCLYLTSTVGRKNFSPEIRAVPEFSSFITQTSGYLYFNPDRDSGLKLQSGKLKRDRPPPPPLCASSVSFVYSVFKFLKFFGFGFPLM